LPPPGPVLAPASSPAPIRTPGRALLGPRPLIDGEDGTNYDVILERISADVVPVDFVEEIWVSNFVDLVWESIRMRHLKSQPLDLGDIYAYLVTIPPLPDQGRGNPGSLASTKLRAQTAQP
jgi:hypothetical protein